MAHMRNVAKERGLLALVQPVIQSARKVTSCLAVVNVRENVKLLPIIRSCCSVTWSIDTLASGFDFNGHIPPLGKVKGT